MIHVRTKNVNGISWIFSVLLLICRKCETFDHESLENTFVDWVIYLQREKPLHYAVVHRKFDCLQAILTAGGDVNQGDKDVNIVVFI